MTLAHFLHALLVCNHTPQYDMIIAEDIAVFTRAVPTDWYRRRWEVLSRDNFTCRYCGQFAPNVMLHVDHVTALADGGDDDLSNLVTSCSACNIGKESFRASISGRRRRYVADPAERELVAGTAERLVYEWLTQNQAPASKEEIIAATEFSERSIDYAISTLKKQNLISYTRDKRRRLWSVVPR